MTDTPADGGTASLEDDRAVIIGGSSGIGLATARAVTDAGGEAIVASRSAEQRQRAVESIDGPVTEYEVDVTDPATIEALFDAVGSFDHLVFTPSYVPNEPYESLSDEDFRRAFEVKFWGAHVAVTNARQSIAEGGSITLTSGNAGNKPAPDFFAIGVVNAAVQMFARYLAVALAPLRVNAVSPGLTDTYGMDEDKRRAVAEATLVGRPGEPEDIAQANLFAMTNPNVSGTVLHVDGGSTLL
jgi:NAD(P)-dependent dehydrogenase (short-subunit alcohol dehydrogenase family)